MSIQELLRTEKLGAGYRHPRQPQKVVLDGISVTVHTGELICLIGPNGAGKSTLLRTLAGMQPLLAGQVVLDGTPIGQLSVQDLARHLSIVLTDRLDVGNLLAYELVSLGRYPYTGWAGRMSDRDHEIVRWSIEAVGADELAHRHVAELSDGERQKLMIARALAQETRLIILDEPTAFLDLPHRVEIMAMLRDLARESDRAILASTHDLDLALRIADRIWLLPMGGPLQVGAPEDMVLSGSFAHAFAKNGLTFDSHDGSFRIDRGRRGTVVLEGDGLSAIWTSRALEREGFQISSNPSADGPRIIVQNDPEPITWRIVEGESDHTHETIYGAVQQLKEIWGRNGNGAQ